MTKSKNRGQLFSGDLAVATILFISTLALAFFLWNSSTEDINKAEALRDLQRIAASTTEQLIRTPGTPPDWNTQWDLRGQDISNGVPGLATSARVIDPIKANSFIDMMNSTYYEQYKHLLGLGEYDFYMEVTNLTGSMVGVNGKPFVVGKPLSNSEASVAVLRTAIFNNTIVRVTFIIWK